MTNTDKYQNISEHVQCTDGNFVFVSDISKDNENVYTFIKLIGRLCHLLLYVID